MAYLDGELPPEDCRRIEERLAADAEYRQQLRELDQAWEALNVLPAPKANDDFARTTMELVTVAAKEDASAASGRAAHVKRRRGLWFATAAVAGAVLGFGAARLFLPNPNEELLRDLPAIHHVDTLRQIESVGFLQALASAGMAERLVVDPSELKKEVGEYPSLAAPSLQVRRAWIDELPEQEKIILAAQADRFRALEESDRTRVRQIEQAIRAGDEELKRTFLAYEQWLNGLTAGQREELRMELSDSPVEEQVDIVRDFIRDDREQSSRRLLTQDADALRTEVMKVAAERGAALARERSRRDDDDSPRQFERRLLILLARQLFRNDDEGREIRERLTSGLSPEAREYLDSLSGGRRAFQLWRWIVESMQTKVDSATLERFFAEKLDNEKREELLSLPAGEMQDRLERLYYATELGFENADLWWSDFREWGPPAPRRGPEPGFRPDGPPRERMGPRPDRPPRPREGEFRDDRRRPERFGPGPGGRT